MKFGHVFTTGRTVGKAFINNFSEGGGAQRDIIGTKSMKNNTSKQRAKTSGNPEFSQTHLAISI